MKKRNLLVSLVLAFALMLTACGQENPFTGTWRGTCDLTDYIIAGVVGDDETMAEYMEFEDLEFVIDFEFTESQITMSVDEASLQTFVTHFEAGMIKMMEGMLVDQLEAYGISYEEYVAESGMDSETLMKSMLDEMDLASTMNAMVTELSASLELSGSYRFNDGVLTVTYEDNTYEEMTYVFDEETLTITVSDGVDEFSIVCEKVN